MKDNIFLEYTGFDIINLTQGVPVEVTRIGLDKQVNHYLIHKSEIFLLHLMDYKGGIKKFEVTDFEKQYKIRILR